MSGNLIFNKIAKGTGTIVYGELIWGAEKYNVVSGGHGNGALPDGLYTIKIRHAVVGTKGKMKPGLIDPKSKKGKGWFLPIEPKFKTKRNELGIHPDGNLPGTEGCVGLQGDDSQKFWHRWDKRTSMSKRPTSLIVQTVVIRHSSDSGT